VITYILLTLYVIACFVLILFVLLQPGKSDAAAVFGGGANSSAFGPRGTATVLAKVTIGAAIVFFLIAFLFSIPGLFEQRSLGESVPAETAAPVTPPAATEQTPPPATSESPTTNQPAASPATMANQNAGAQARPQSGAANSNGAQGKKP
jgi:preprotein translocase subunit SecG